MRKSSLKSEIEQEVLSYSSSSNEDDLRPYWEVAGDQYESCLRDCEEEEFFRKQLRDYEKKYFDGKRWEEVDPIIRDVWSDLYKAVNGVRPYHIPFGCIA